MAFQWIKKLFGRKDTTDSAPTAETTAPTSPETTSTPTAPTTKKRSTKTATKRAPSKVDVTSKNPQCAAVTASGSQCSRQSRDNSKYCGVHKNYRASKSTTEPTSGGSKRTNGASKTSTGGKKTPVSHNGYKLYKKGNRYWFGKKATQGAQLVYSMPSDRTIVETNNGLPVLKKKN